MVFWAKTKTLLTTQRNSTGKQLKPLSWKDNHSFKPCPNIRPRRRNLKRSFISTFRPTVHTNPSRKRSFSKTLFKPKEFEGRLYVLDGKQFENDSFTIITWFLCPSFSQTEKSMITDKSVDFKLGLVWTQNILFVFRMNTSFSNFSWEVWTMSNFEGRSKGLPLLTG